MKFRYSCLHRRSFLRWLGSGWLGALVGTLLYPLLKTVIPPYKEPEEVALPLTELADFPLNSVKIFFWGVKPGILQKKEDGSLQAFIGVCTHLDCNVQYLPEQHKFFCACHNGWYDENGINIAGPPPRPLRRLIIIEEMDKLILRREEKT